jgi:hypothetical protein
MLLRSTCSAHEVTAPTTYLLYILPTIQHVPWLSTLRSCLSCMKLHSSNTRPLHHIQQQQAPFILQSASHRKVGPVSQDDQATDSGGARQDSRLGSKLGNSRRHANPLAGQLAHPDARPPAVARHEGLSTAVAEPRKQHGSQRFRPLIPPAGQTLGGVPETQRNALRGL